MERKDLARLEAHFERALELRGAQRRAYLDTVARESAPMAERLEGMLADDAEASLGPAFIDFDESHPDAGATLGNYRLIEPLGSGGFGVVWRAEQTAPVRREVALKLLKLGMDTREVVARFEAERQALAMMDHPGIAKVLDAGATPNGRPYFVMELVDGQAITRFADEARLSIAERMRLFCEVCEAVQHAHQKGIVHRDLKPSNVLVALRDGRPAPKVIDFGIAKALDVRLTDATLTLHDGGLMGTPIYMSPEQAGCTLEDVDTRADVYSLGALLHELLAGSPPFGPELFQRAGVDSIRAIIGDREPCKPSVAAAELSAERCQARGASQAALCRALAGEVDWIVGKALAKQRDARYAGASEMAADVARHLDGDTVLAGPPSTRYRLRKALRRHRVVATWLAVLLVCLIAGIVGTSVGLIEAAEQRDEALRKAHKSERMIAYLDEVLSLADPAVARNPSLSVRQLLEVAGRRLDDGILGAYPDAEARARITIGKAWASLGVFPIAEKHLRSGIAVFDAASAHDDRLLFEALWALTGVAFKNELPDAYAISFRAMNAAKRVLASRRPALGGELARWFESTIAMKIDAAEAAFDAFWPAMEAALPEGDPDRLIAADMAMACTFALWYSEHETRVVPWCEKALEIREAQLAPGHKDTSESLSMLVGILNRAGRAGEGEQRLRAVVDRMERDVPADHSYLADVRGTLGESLVAQGRYAEAEPLLLASHEAIAAIWPEHQFFHVDSIARLAQLYDLWDKPALAVPYRERLGAVLLESAYLLDWEVAQQVIPEDEVALTEALGRLDQRIGWNQYQGVAVRQSGAELVTDVQAIVARLESPAPLSEAAGIVAAHMLLSAQRLLEFDDPGLVARLQGSYRKRLVANAERAPWPAAEALLSVAANAPLGTDPALRSGWADTAEVLLQRPVNGVPMVLGGIQVRTGALLIDLGRIQAGRRLLDEGARTLLALFGPKHEGVLHAQRLLRNHALSVEGER